MKVIDRFLSEKEFERLKSEMMAYNFQWHMSKIVDDNEANKSRNMQFIHMLIEFINNQPISQHYSKVGNTIMHEIWEG